MPSPRFDTVVEVKSSQNRRPRPERAGAVSWGLATSIVWIAVSGDGFDDRAAAVGALAAAVDPGLGARLRFLVELEKLKGVERRSPALGGARWENSAEHSWHLALFATVLAPHAREPVDVGRVVTMLLVHDVVEIDAGDTYIYDAEAVADQAVRELAAAERIYSLLPGGEGEELRALWTEYERQDTADARFAHAVDRLQPLLLNYLSAGRSWEAHAVATEQVREVNGRMATGSDELWEVASRLIDDAVDRGWLPGRVQ
jgi:putative hydrolase of HD superfamily